MRGPTLPVQLIPKYAAGQQDDLGRESRSKLVHPKDSQGQSPEWRLDARLDSLDDQGQRNKENKEAGKEDGAVNNKTSSAVGPPRRQRLFGNRT